MAANRSPSTADLCQMRAANATARAKVRSPWIVRFLYKWARNQSETTPKRGYRLSRAISGTPGSSTARDGAIAPVRGSMPGPLQVGSKRQLHAAGEPRGALNLRRNAI